MFQILMSESYTHPSHINLIHLWYKAVTSCQKQDQCSNLVPAFSKKSWTKSYRQVEMNLWSLVPIKKNWQMHLITFYKKQLRSSRAKLEM